MNVLSASCGQGVFFWTARPDKKTAISILRKTRLGNLEAEVGIEPTHDGFANLCHP